MKKRSSGLFSQGIPFSRPAALLVSACLLFSDIPLLASPPPVPEPPVSFSMPAEFGRLEESRPAPGKTIIFIQDAHDSLEAQENIAALITHFVRDAGVKTVFEEGYEGPVPGDAYFGAIEDREVREKVSYYLLDQLRIGGAEYAHINREKDFALIGGDDAKLHLQNVEWYRRTAAGREDAARGLAELQAEILRLANRHFPAELKEWMKLRKRFDERRLGLPDYLLRLRDTAPDFFTDGVLEKTAALRHPNLAALYGMLRDPEAKETDAQPLDARALFREISELENEIAGKLLSRENDRKTFEYYKALELLTRLNGIEISYEEYSALRETMTGYTTDDFAAFIARERGRPAAVSRRWEENIASAMKFYETAELRDRAVEKKLLAFREKADEDTAVLVFGGFHRQAIRDMLRRHGFGYYVVTPQISGIEETHQARYRHLMAADYSERFSAARVAARAARALSDLAVANLAPAYEAGLHLEISRLAEAAGQANGETRADQLLQMSLALEEAPKSEPRLPLDNIYDSLLLYPKALIHSRGLEAYLDDFDREHYEFIEEQDGKGYWRSKDFENPLILGTWEDVRDGGHPAKLQHDVVTRFRGPDGKPVSFYFFDDHARSAMYAMEAAARGEVPVSGNTQIFFDSHPDGPGLMEDDGAVKLKPEGMTYPAVGNAEDLRRWDTLTGPLGEAVIHMANFNDALIQSGFLARHFWVADSLKIGSIFPDESYDHPFYFESVHRPKNAAAIVNVDTDASGYIFYKGAPEAPVLTRKHFDGLSQFVLRVAREDRVSVSTFHASTTFHSAEGSGPSDASGYGHTALTRFMARFAPVAFLTDEKEVRQNLLRKWARVVSSRQLKAYQRSELHHDPDIETLDDVIRVNDERVREALEAGAITPEKAESYRQTFRAVRRVSERALEIFVDSLKKNGIPVPDTQIVWVGSRLSGRPLKQVRKPETKMESDIDLLAGYGRMPAFWQFLEDYDSHLAAAFIQAIEEQNVPAGLDYRETEDASPLSGAAQRRLENYAEEMKAKTKIQLIPEDLWKPLESHEIELDLRGLPRLLLADYRAAPVRSELRSEDEAGRKESRTERRRLERAREKLLAARKALRRRVIFLFFSSAALATGAGIYWMLPDVNEERAARAPSEAVIERQKLATIRGISVQDSTRAIISQDPDLIDAIAEGYDAADRIRKSQIESFVVEEPGMGESEPVFRVGEQPQSVVIPAFENVSLTVDEEGRISPLDLEAVRDSVSGGRAQTATEFKAWIAWAPLAVLGIIAVLVYAAVKGRRPVDSGSVMDVKSAAERSKRDIDRLRAAAEEKRRGKGEDGRSELRDSGVDFVKTPQDLTWLLGMLEKLGFLNVREGYDDRAWFEFNGREPDPEAAERWVRGGSIFHEKKQAAYGILKDRLETDDGLRSRNILALTDTSFWYEDDSDFLPELDSEAGFTGKRLSKIIGPVVSPFYDPSPSPGKFHLPLSADGEELAVEKIRRLRFVSFASRFTSEAERYFYAPNLTGSLGVIIEKMDERPEVRVAAIRAAVDLARISLERGYNLASEIMVPVDVLSDRLPLDERLSFDGPMVRAAAEGLLELLETEGPHENDLRGVLSRSFRIDGSEAEDYLARRASQASPFLIPETVSTGTWEEDYRQFVSFFDRLPEALFGRRSGLELNRHEAGLAEALASVSGQFREKGYEADSLAGNAVKAAYILAYPKRRLNEIYEEAAAGSTPLSKLSVEMGGSRLPLAEVLSRAFAAAEKLRETHPRSELRSSVDFDIEGYFARQAELSLPDEMYRGFAGPHRRDAGQRPYFLFANEFVSDELIEGPDAVRGRGGVLVAAGLGMALELISQAQPGEVYLLDRDPRVVQILWPVLLSLMSGSENRVRFIARLMADEASPEEQEALRDKSFGEIIRFFASPKRPGDLAGNLERQTEHFYALLRPHVDAAVPDEVIRQTVGGLLLMLRESLDDADVVSAEGDFSKYAYFPSGASLFEKNIDEKQGSLANEENYQRLRALLLSENFHTAVGDYLEQGLKNLFGRLRAGGKTADILYLDNILAYASDGPKTYTRFYEEVLASMPVKDPAEALIVTSSLRTDTIATSAKPDTLKNYLARAKSFLPETFSYGDYESVVHEQWMSAYWIFVSPRLTLAQKLEVLAEEIFNFKAWRVTSDYTTDLERGLGLAFEGLSEGQFRSADEFWAHYEAEAAEAGLKHVETRAEVRPLDFRLINHTLELLGVAGRSELRADDARQMAAGRTGSEPVRISTTPVDGLYTYPMDPLLDDLRELETGSEIYEQTITAMKFNGNMAGYRKVREYYAEVPDADAQRKKDLIDVLRNIQYLGLAIPNEEGIGHDYVNRRTWEGRSAPTYPALDAMVAQHEANGQPVVIGDFAVSDGTSALELARRYENRNVRVVGYDYDLGYYILHYDDGDLIIDQHGRPVHYEIDGEYAPIPPNAAEMLFHSFHEMTPGQLEEMLRTGRLEYVSLLNPEAEAYAAEHPGRLEFRRQNVFEPVEERHYIARVLGLLMRTDPYFPPEKILEGLTQLGNSLEPGGYLMNGTLWEGGGRWESYRRDGDNLVSAPEYSYGIAGGAEEIIPLRSELRDISGEEYDLIAAEAERIRELIDVYSLLPNKPDGTGKSDIIRALLRARDLSRERGDIAEIARIVKEANSWYPGRDKYNFLEHDNQNIKQQFGVFSRMVQSVLRRSRSELRMPAVGPEVEEMTQPAAVFLDARELVNLTEGRGDQRFDEILVLLERHPAFDLYIDHGDRYPLHNLKNEKLTQILTKFSGRVHFGELDRANLAKKTLVMQVSLLEEGAGSKPAGELIDDIRRRYGIKEDILPIEYLLPGTLKGFLDLAESLTPGELLREIGEAWATRTAGGRWRIAADFAASLWTRIQSQYAIEWSA